MGAPCLLLGNLVHGYMICTLHGKLPIGCLPPYDYILAAQIGIAKIASASLGKNSVSINSFFRPQPSLSSSSATFASRLSSLGDDCMVKVVGHGIHLSPQILVSSPLPIRQNNPSLRRSHEPKILLHAYDGLFPNFASNKELLA